VSEFTAAAATCIKLCALQPADEACLPDSTDNRQVRAEALLAARTEQVRRIDRELEATLDELARLRGELDLTRPQLRGTQAQAAPAVRATAPGAARTRTARADQGVSRRNRGLAGDAHRRTGAGAGGGPRPRRGDRDQHDVARDPAAAPFSSGAAAGPAAAMT